MNFKKIFVCFLIFILLILFFPFNVHALVSDIKIKDVPDEVKNYLSAISVEFNDKENYGFFIQRYAGKWACLALNKNNLPAGLCFYYYRDVNGSFIINQNDPSSIFVVRYDIATDLSSYSKRSYNEYWGPGYCVEFDSSVDGNYTLFYCDFPIYTDSTCTELLYSPGPTFQNPYIVNSAEDLASGNFDTLLIEPGDYDIVNNDLYLHMCKKTNVSTSDIYYTDYVYVLSFNGKYYESFEDGIIYYFSIDKSSLPFNFNNDERYIFYLSSSSSNLGGSYTSDIVLTGPDILDSKVFTIGGLTEEDKQLAYQDKISTSLDEQKQSIEENTKTNKNIFERIGDILSFINPFSENFFGKKLVELILEGLKSLFVPEEGFFSTYFDDLKNWFSDRLGFLWSPFDIVIEILNRILNINFSEPVIVIPEIQEGFTGEKLISSQEYNLNDLLNNDIFNNIHNIYLVCVDAIILFALIHLAERKIEEVFSN